MTYTLTAGHAAFKLSGKQQLPDDMQSQFIF